MLFLTAMCRLSYAQTSPGSFLLGADSELGWLFSSRNVELFDPSTGKLERTRVQSFNISGNIGYFLLDGFALGIDFQIASSNEQRSTLNGTGRTFLVGPFVRYYFPSDNIRAFAGLGAATGVESANWTGKNFESNFENVINQASAEGGVSFFLNSHLSIEGVLLFLYEGQHAKNVLQDRGSQDRVDNEGSVWEYGLKIGFRIFL